MPKPKRQLSEKQLAQLAKAREKANAVRKQNAVKRNETKAKAAAKTASMTPARPPTTLVIFPWFLILKREELWRP